MTFDKEKAKFHTDQIDLHNQALKDMIEEGEAPPSPGPVIVVSNEDELDQALKVGGQIELSVGSSFSKSYDYLRDETFIRGQGNNQIIGLGAPALDVPLSLYNLSLRDVELQTSKHDILMLLGRNDTSQVELDKVPSRIVIEGLKSTGHRGKRGIEVNAEDVVIKNVDIRDIYSPAKIDSQCICVLNSPGNIHISDSHLEGAVENMMVGGDAMKLQNTRPTNITVIRTVFTKNLAWKGDAAIPVKNLFELKDGINVLVRDCEFSNSWVSAQDGYCFTFTPRRGGEVLNVMVENANVKDVSAIANIMGVDDNYATLRRTQTSFKGGTFKTNKAQMGGRGWFALVTNGPEYLIIDGVDATIDGSCFIGIEGTSERAKVDQFHLINSKWNYGSYGIRLGGYSHGDNQLGVVKDIKIEGCTIQGAHSSFRARYPNNTYVSNMSAEREREVDAKQALAAFDREMKEAVKRAMIE